jgi:hypothetical protein
LKLVNALVPCRWGLLDQACAMSYECFHRLVGQVQPRFGPDTHTPVVLECHQDQSPYSGHEQQHMGEPSHSIGEHRSRKDQLQDGHD